MKNLFRYEWKRNVLARKYQYLLPMFLALQVCIMLFNNIGSGLEAEGFYHAFLEGMPPMPEDPMGMDVFRIPGDWCLFFIFFLYITGKQAKDYTGGIGMQILLRTQNAGHLWTAKWIGSILRTTVYFGAAYIAIAVFCIWNTGGIAEAFLSGSELWRQIFLPIVAASVIAVWQMVISMLTNTLLGVISMTALLVTSAYYERWYLIGNYLMKMRVDELVDAGRSLGSVAAFLFVLLAAGIVAGNIIIKRADYIRSKGDL